MDFSIPDVANSCKSQSVQDTYLDGSSNSIDNSFNSYPSKLDKIIIYPVKEKCCVPDVMQVISGSIKYIIPSITFLKKNKIKDINRYTTFCRFLVS